MPQMKQEPKINWLLIYLYGLLMLAQLLALITISNKAATVL